MLLSVQKKFTRIAVLGELGSRVSQITQKSSKTCAPKICQLLWQNSDISEISEFSHAIFLFPQTPEIFPKIQRIPKIDKGKNFFARFSIFEF